MASHDNPASAAQTSLIARVSEPLYTARGWMKLAGALVILYGVLTALTIVGLLIAWIPIWMGVLLFQSAKAVEQAHLASDEQAFLLAQLKLKTYFVITGVLALIVLLLAVLQVVGMGLGMFMHWETMQQIITSGP